MSNCIKLPLPLLLTKRRGHSRQPTILVNDAYLRLREQKNIDPALWSQVMATGAAIIRRLLIDYARAASVVEMKYFGGLSGDEIAEQLVVSIRTVHDDWRIAKASLYRTLGSE